MLANERQAKIAELIKRDRAVTTAELMRRFDVSIETVRRDLLILEKRELLQRVHGGAVALGGMMPRRELAQRIGENDAQKRELSRTATGFIREGDTVGIDSGSTAIYLAREIRERFSSLTVITHSLDVFNIISENPDIKLILAGGCFMRASSAFYGSPVLDTLSRLHMDKVFVFPYSVSIHGGLCDNSDELILVQRQLIKSADSVYVLADSSKFEKSALIKMDDANRQYTYVTDSAFPAELKQLYKENDLRIVSCEQDIHI